MQLQAILADIKPIVTNPLESSIRYVVDLAKAAAGARKLTLSLLGNFLLQLVTIVVHKLVEEQLTGPEKKALALKAVGEAFDRLEPLLPVPGWLRPFWSFVRSSVRASVIAIADGQIEAIYRLLAKDDPAV